ncbi:MAG TPA: hypothetical protein VK395_15945 [Gemmataceae bacterium]|nr:hypothetical protein [Gemmataceae bacterium]
MQLSNRSDVKSFLLVLYDGDLREIARFQLPVEVAAPLCNRLLRETLAGVQVREPWYTLKARYDRSFNRSPTPMGPTSLFGSQYDAAAEAGPSLSVHPDAGIRSFEVSMLDFQRELFRGEYSAEDLFLHPVRYVLNGLLEKGKLTPECGPFCYAVLPSRETVQNVSKGLLPAQAYQAEGVFRLPPPVSSEPSIAFRPVVEPPFPERDPATFGPLQVHGKGEHQSGRVFLPAIMYADFRQNWTFSSLHEEGGYILGNVYRQPGSSEREDRPGFRWLIECTDLLKAEGTVGSPDRLLFTGDAWSKVSRRRDKDFAGRKLVGWYHTHLFAATDNFGLSGLDLNMHALYLPKSWQVALLLNLEAGNVRTVRCYQRNSDGELVETPFGVFG